MAEDKGSFFDDLEKKPADGAAPAEAPKVDEIAKKHADELERERMEKRLLEDKLDKQNKARAQLRRELKERDKELADLKKAADPNAPIPTEKKEDEEDPVEVDLEEAPTPKKTEETVEQVVERKLYEKSVAGAVKSRVKYREEAEVLHATVMKLIAGGLSTGDPEEDVVRAEEILKPKKTDTIPSPSSISGGPAPERRGAIPKSTLEMGKVFGHTKEDWEKYGGEIKL